ncbi:MAG: hypoxanthine phosphoribosyltransferase [Candidatus Marinimicrobia bacterium]|nr:hypoxanthine phosphoribosyltransferase [Candidatus Neomarinimicrobiota bacterium]MCF7839604.1 hypoxanthine phosphoribosyltransferase [Candidatus Neomarinimicrobiota bacterium]
MKTKIAENVGKYSGQPLEELLSTEVIRERIRELGQQISADYAGKTPIIIGVLNGSFIFMADLVREMTTACEIDFIKISSYYDDVKSSGTVRLIKDISCMITHRDVIVVEDIIDSGLTAKFMRQRLLDSEPASVAFATLLLKPDVVDVPFDIEYVGFRIPNRFVVGYGLDLDQKMRNFPAIWAFPEGMEV